MTRIPVLARNATKHQYAILYISALLPIIAPPPNNHNGVGAPFINPYD
jgi:hypothetical protein